MKKTFKATITAPQALYADKGSAARDDLFEPMLNAQSDGQKQTLRQSQFHRKQIDKIEGMTTAQRRRLADEFDTVFAGYEADVLPYHQARRAQREVCGDLAKAVRAFGRAGKSVPPGTWEALECAMFVGAQNGMHDRRLADVHRQLATMKAAIQNAEGFARACEKAAKQPQGPPAAIDHLISELARAWAVVIGQRPTHSARGQFAKLIKDIFGHSAGSERLSRLIKPLNLTAPPPRRGRKYQPSR